MAKDNTSVVILITDFSGNKTWLKVTASKAAEQVKMMTLTGLPRKNILIYGAGHEIDDATLARLNNNTKKSTPAARKPRKSAIKTPTVPTPDPSSKESTDEKIHQASEKLRAAIDNTPSNPASKSTLRDDADISHPAIL
jgi:LAS superfamily LD-carboxypeptidase LdcB